MKVFGIVVLSLSIFLAGCKSKPPIVVHVPVTSKGCPAAFVSEHNDLFAENLKLRHALKLANEKNQ